MSVLEIVTLEKSYANGVQALAGISLSLKDGEVVSLLGPSGCGKSTILKCIAGLEQPTQGEIRIDDDVVASSRRNVPIEKRNVGLVFQSYALWPHKTVFENVALGLKLRKVPARAVREQVMESLGMLEIDHLKDRLPGQISGGQQQRVALSRALVLHPRVLLFDEPLSNLDAVVRDRVRNDLYDLLQRVKITTLYVTHDRNEAMCMSSRIAVLREGRVEQLGSARDLYENPASSFVAGFVGSCNLVPVVKVGNGADEKADVLRMRASDDLYTRASDTGGVDAYFAFRPQDVELGAHPSGLNTFSAAVIRQTYFGSEIELVATVGAQRFRISLQQEVVADEVLFHVPVEKAIRLAE